MAYDKRYRQHAKEELARAQATYGSRFTSETEALLDSICQDTEKSERFKNGPSLTSAFFLEFASEFLDVAVDQMTDLNRRKYIIDRFWNASLRDKARGFLRLIETGEFPYDIRVQLRWFRPVDTVANEVFVYYEVDHVERIVVFTKFAGLPGEEC